MKFDWVFRRPKLYSDPWAEVMDYQAAREQETEKYPGRSPILESFPPHTSDRTDVQMLHFASYRCFYMFIQYQGGSYRLVDTFDVNGKYGPWKSEGEMSNLGDYCTDGHDIFKLEPMKPKRCELLREPSSENGVFPLKDKTYYVRDNDTHRLVIGESMSIKSLALKVLLGKLEAQPDGSVVEWWEDR